MPEIIDQDVLKLQELKRQETEAYERKDYFTLNDVRGEIYLIEVKYHARLDAERYAEWGRMPPHP